MRFPNAARACLTVMFMLPAAAFAQASSPHAKVLTQEYRGESVQIQPETYGTSSLTYVSLSPFDFRPQGSSTTYASAFSPVGIYPTAVAPFEAPVRLPEGALVSYLELYSCGTGGANFATYFRGARTDTLWSSVAGPLSPASGCSVTSVSITPVVIDNSTTSYTVEAEFQSFQFGRQGGRVPNWLQTADQPRSGHGDIQPTCPSDILSTGSSKRWWRRESRVAAAAAITVPMRRSRVDRWLYSCRALSGCTGRRS